MPSSKQFCVLGQVSPFVLPTLWVGLGLVVWSRAPSQLQPDFGTDGTERLQGGKKGEESAVKAKILFFFLLKVVPTIKEVNTQG